jgi:hypothetical protein
MSDRERLIRRLIAAASYPYTMDSRSEIELLADYLLENGVILPPCKVGQEVWLVFTPKFPANPADKGKWFMTQDGVQRIILGAKGFSVETWNVGTIPAKEIGKKLFLTREEAEKELAERRANNDKKRL